MPFLGYLVSTQLSIGDNVRAVRLSNVTVEGNQWIEISSCAEERPKKGKMK
jgi:hypothetical protein